VGEALWFGLGWARDLIGVSFLMIGAYGGLAGAGAGFLARFHPAAPAAVSRLAVLACAVVSSWSFSGLHHDRQAELEAAHKNLSLARAALAHEQLVRRLAQEQARARADQAEDLQDQVDDYANALAAGTAARAPADDDYERRMRAIRIGR